MVQFSTVTPEVCRSVTPNALGPPVTILSSLSVTLLATMLTLSGMYNPDSTAPLPSTWTQPRVS